MAYSSGYYSENYEYGPTNKDYGYYPAEARYSNSLVDSLRAHSFAELYNEDRGRNLMKPVKITGGEQPMVPPAFPDEKTIEREAHEGEIGNNLRYEWDSIYGDKTSELQRTGQIPTTRTAAVDFLTKYVNSQSPLNNTLYTIYSDQDTNLDPRLYLAANEDFRLRTDSLYDETGAKPQTYVEAARKGIESYLREVNLLNPVSALGGKEKEFSQLPLKDKIDILTEAGTKLSNAPMSQTKSDIVGRLRQSIRKKRGMTEEEEISGLGPARERKLTEEAEIRGLRLST